MKNSNFKKILSTVLFLALVLTMVFTITSCKKHDLTENVVAATCTEDGCITRTCNDANCDYVETEVIPALGHDLVDHAKQAPGCTTVGWDAYQTCTRCDYTTYEEIPAHGHDAVRVRWDNYVEPDCTNDGSYIEVTYCETCNTELQRVDKTEEAYGHAWQTIPAKAATCLPGNYEYKRCVVCGATDLPYEVYHIEPEYDHVWSKHLVEISRTHAECTVEGHYEEAILCTNDGCKTIKEGTVVSTPIEALGHAVVNHEAKAPTCTTIGWEAYEDCSRCNDYSTYVELPKLGHDYVPHEGQAETCTEDGWEAYNTCTRCDYSSYTVIEAHPHTPTEIDIDMDTLVYPTCDTEGFYVRVIKCSECHGELYREDWPVEALGHNILTIPALAPTCTEDGHNEHKRCSKCGYTEGKEVIPALTHDLTKHDAKAPTCEAIGNEAWEECSRCDHNTYVELPALGHDIKDLAPVAPTCTEDGLTAGKDCSRCDAVDVAQEVIPALTHDYDANGVCTICGEKTSVGLYAELVNGGYVITGLGSCTDKDVVIPSEINGVPVVALGDDLFKRSAVESVVIPYSVKTIGEETFFSCTALKSVVIGDGVETIGDYAFFGCSRLATVTLGNGVKTIGAHAFDSCYKLATVNYTGTAAQWNSIAIGSDNGKLTSATRYYI